MSTKTVRLEISFQKLIPIIDQLDQDEKLILKKKLEKRKVTQSASGHFVLSNDDFDRLAIDLRSDREPSEAVKRARGRFAQLR